MRDGVHRTLPMSRDRRTFAKRCANKAEHGERTEEAAQRIVETMVRTEIGGGFLRKLVKQVDGPRLFDPLAGLTSRDFGGDGNVLQERTLDHLRFACARGLVGNDAVRDAVERTVTERREADLRNMEGHLRANGGRDVQYAVDESCRAYRSVDIRAVAESALAGTPRAAAPPRDAFDVDMAIM
jgi:hypothetical protein